MKKDSRKSGGDEIRKGNIATASVILIFLNIFDAASTVYLIENGVGTEGNPFMKYFYDMGIWAFLVSKFSLMGFGLWLLNKLKAEMMIWLCNIFYTVLAGYHFLILVGYLSSL
jgi:hypothetical protein